jgi:hypothetical protein
MNNSPHWPMRTLKPNWLDFFRAKTSCIVAYWELTGTRNSWNWTSSSRLIHRSWNEDEIWARYQQETGWGHQGEEKGTHCQVTRAIRCEDPLGTKHLIALLDDSLEWSSSTYGRQQIDRFIRKRAPRDVQTLIKDWVGGVLDNADLRVAMVPANFALKPGLAKWILRSARRIECCGWSEPQLRRWATPSFHPSWS